MDHQHPAALAGARTPAGSGDDAFVDGLRFVARRLYFSAPDLEAPDKQFLQDVARNEARFPMTGLRRLMRIAAQSTKPEDREALAELIRAECLVGVHAVDVAIAFDEETEAQGIADNAARQFERHPSPATKARAVETLTAHYHRIRRSLDAVLACGRVTARNR